ncbi:uncharacterized protein C8A04DRAFT_14975 [Dichotomopilus funicola]|uniref:DUF7587 domain-containing protein n=1 Tax=Dichotomopilus funicola TaxID=1934379 RepID=A0AAN6UYT3_9PEZI|nr:hypothetical protein C8A04DRAFT_14975 [Dichotomopilus funicola]
MTSPRPPPNFYRVQHDQSFTEYDDGRFESKAHYVMNYHHWVNAKKFHQHLDWKSRVEAEYSPFISVFDNKADAKERARFHLERGCKGVFIAQISSQSLRPTTLEIESSEKIVNLPAWEDPVTGCIFLSTPDVRLYLGVDSRQSSVSEWFALDCISEELITRTTHC